MVAIGLAAGKDVTAGLDARNTLIAGNIAPAGPDVQGPVVSLGHNLIGDVSGSTGFGNEGDILGNSEEAVDPRLSPLRDFGGPTPVRAPLFNSPAIDAGDEEKFLDTDQRGIDRPQDGDQDGNAVADIGAVEVRPPDFSVGLPFGTDVILRRDGAALELFNKTDGEPIVKEPFNPFGSIQIKGAGGDESLQVNGAGLDDIEIDDGILSPVALHGNAGDDKLIGGGTEFDANNDALLVL